MYKDYNNLLPVNLQLLAMSIIIPDKLINLSVELLIQILVKSYPCQVVPAASHTRFFTLRLYPVLASVNHLVPANIPI